MKAIRKSDGKVIEVREWRGASDVVYSDPDMNRFYQASDLDFNVEEAEQTESVMVSGWIAIDEAYDACFLHTLKPHQESQGIADTGDYYTVWESDGKAYLLDKGFFPNMDSDSDPLEVTITIKPKKKSSI